MKKNENGRSMIEMLGVLAVIGVLSVGGIYGYTVAMRRHRANEIVQTASMLVTMAKSANVGEGTCLRLTDSGIGNTPAGVEMEMIARADQDSTTVDFQITTPMSNDEITALCDAIGMLVPNDGSQGYVKNDCGASQLTDC